MSAAKDPKVVKVINEKDILIGYAICYERYKSYYHVWQLGVSEEFRNQGVASKMYDVIESYAKNNIYKGVTLNTFEDYKRNILLIEKRGYKLYKKDTSGKYSENPKLMYKKHFN